MKYTVDQQALNKVIKNLQNDSDKALKYCWEYLAEKISLQLKEDKAYDLWNLARSIDYRLVRHWLVEVWSALVYAPIVEYGRQPWKFPPLDALVGWTSRKWMIKGWPTQKYNNLHYTDKWVIYVIARSIANKGIKWRHTFQNVVNRERKNIQQIYIDYMSKW
jgi:hypothetical protein